MLEEPSDFILCSVRMYLDIYKNVSRHIDETAISFQLCRVSNMIKTYAIISFFVCFLPTVTCHSYQLIGTEALSEELVAQHYTITPNLDAVIVVDRTIPTFEYQTFYGAGVADEKESQQGRIHFLEHIMAGTSSYEPGKITQIIANNGGKERAATTYHFMYFVMRFPKNKFDLAVEIDRGRFYNTVINEEVVEREKKIVLTERSYRLTRSTLRFANYFFSLIYKKKNFDDIGTEDFIKQLKPDDLKDYYENFLRRQKRLIVVIGDVDVNHVLMKLDEAYGNVKDQKPRQFHPDHQFPNPEILGKEFNIAEKNLNSAKFRKIWYTPKLGHRDYAGLLILAHMLNKSSNSLRSTVVDSGLASAFGVELNHLKGFSLMICAADLSPDTSLDTIKTIIHAELEKIKSQGISEDELNAARNQQLRTMYSTFYNRSSMAYSFGRAFAHANNPLLYPKLIKDLKSICKEDISRIIALYLSDENSITLSLTLKKQAIGIKIVTIAIIVGMAAIILFLLRWKIKKLHQKVPSKGQ